MAMPPMVEGDEHIGHACDGENFHKTAYVSGASTKVFIGGKPIILVGDTTSCGDPAVIGSSTVFVSGRAIHRQGDATGGHGCWVPNQASTSSAVKVMIG